MFYNIFTQWSIAVAWSMFRWQPSTRTSLILPCVTHTHAMQSCQLCTGDPVFLAQVDLSENICWPLLTSLILPCVTHTHAMQSCHLCTGDPLYLAQVDRWGVYVSVADGPRKMFAWILTLLCIWWHTHPDMVRLPISYYATSIFPAESPVINSLYIGAMKAAKSEW